MDDDGLWQVPSPIQDERHVATAIGQSELAIRQAHSRTFVLDAKVPASLVRWPGCWISFTALPPTFETGKERLYTSIGGMRMQLVRGEQPLQVLLFEPNALMPHRTPKEHQRVRIEQTTFTGQLIELCRFPDVDATDLIHPV